MNVFTLSIELAAIRSHTYKGIACSFLAHVLLFLWLMAFKSFMPVSAGVIEITWIEPAEAAPVIVPAASGEIPPALQENSTPWKPSSQEPKMHFLRDMPEADIALQPQNAEIVEDRLGERLAFLQRDASQKRINVANLVQTKPLGRSSLASIPAQQGVANQRIDLTRQQSSNQRSVELLRAEVRHQRSSLAITKGAVTPIAPASAKTTDSSARRLLAGATLQGPVVDRPLISYATPIYPEWAKRQAIEASVTLHFVVLPDGRVKENVFIQKTSAYEDFDDNATSALLAWRFEPLKGEAIGEQWGLITFHYKLSDS
jgi:TonB family protein